MEQLTTGSTGWEQCVHIQPIVIYARTHPHAYADVEILRPFRDSATLELTPALWNAQLASRVSWMHMKVVVLYLAITVL